MIKKIRDKLEGDIHLKELITGSVITFFLKIFGMLLGFVLIFIISKKTGAEGVGFYSLFNQMLMVLSMIVGLGMNTSVLRFIGQFNNERERSKIHLLPRYILRLVTPLSVMIGLFLFFCADYITRLLGKNEEYAMGIRLIGFILPFFATNQISVEFIRGLKKLQVSELIRSLTLPIFMVIALLTLWKKQLDSIEIICLFVVGAIMNSVISSGTIWVQLKKIPKDNFNDFTQKELFGISSSMMITSIASSLMTAVPVFFLDYFSTQRDVGVYSIAFRIAQVVTIILVIVNTIAAPKFAELFWAGKKEELQKFISQSTKMMFWIALSLSTIVIIFAKWILKLFGEDFMEGQWILIILIIGQLINATTGSVGVLMNMSGEQRAIRNSSIATLLLLVIFLVFLYQFVGIIAVPIAYTVSTSLWNLYCVVYIFKKQQLITYYCFT